MIRPPPVRAAQRVASTGPRQGRDLDRARPETIVEPSALLRGNWPLFILPNSPGRGGRVRPRFEPNNRSGGRPVTGNPRRTCEDYERGLPDYHDPTAGFGGAALT